MTPHRWQQVRTLLDRALQQPTHRRAAYLDGATDDPDVRSEVEALLTAEPDASFLGAPPPLPLDDFASPDDPAFDAPLPPGTRIGPYRVETLLGEGGMGRVYAACADGAFTQNVALKIVKRGLDTASVRHRFESERQILARLQHLHIAHVLDSGTTDDGLPYFVMERVDGQPITEYARTHRLSIPARLRLLIEVCEAVQYAHQNLVVHRDLKPSNVLVDAAGHVTLLDFGIARLLEGDDEGTELGARPMSRPYAAPEQIANGAITPATDVWALGVLLYELLTGRRPFHSETRAGLEQAILRTPVLPPDRSALVPRHDASHLDDDLDAICLTALAKEPKHRYASANALSAALLRYLDNLATPSPVRQPLSDRP